MAKPLEVQELKELSRQIDEFYIRGLVGIGEGMIQVREEDFDRLTHGMPIEVKDFHGLQHATCNMGGFSLAAVIIHKRRT